MQLNALVMVSGSGVVKEFDESVGLGVITSSDGKDLPFHCTMISDGTRTIEIGRPVCFRVFAAVKGRVEAIEVGKL
ncbi:MAG: cold shock domain-containing protein [Actinomycetota bacterium]|jgi:cold shock CspA family protein|nr:cold shock domain-containing protein [Actinomycetota bacterium]